MSRILRTAMVVFLSVVPWVSRADVPAPPDTCVGLDDGGYCTIIEGGPGGFYDGGPGYCGPGTCFTPYPGPFYSDGGYPSDAGISCNPENKCYTASACLQCQPTGTTATTGSTAAAASSGSSGSTVAGASTGTTGSTASTSGSTVSTSGSTGSTSGSTASSGGASSGGARPEPPVSPL